MQLQSSHPESCGRSGHPLQLYRRVQKCSVKDTGRSENEIKDCHRRKCHHQLWQDKNPYRPAFPAAVLCRRGSRSLRCPFCTPRTRAKMGMKKRGAYASRFKNSRFPSPWISRKPCSSRTGAGQTPSVSFLNLIHGFFLVSSFKAPCLSSAQKIRSYRRVPVPAA